MRYFLLLSILLIISCKKDINFENQYASLEFSNDTIIFDTTFQSIGTSTQTLTVYNNNDFNIITNISLSTNENGSFRINVDGIPLNEMENTNVNIKSNDSIFIFLEVTPSENNMNSFLITNVLNFNTGGKNQDVKLVCPGKNAIFHILHDNFINDSITYKYYSISENTTWTNELPHVVYGQVVVEPGVTLTIEEGTNIYFYNNSGIIVGNPIYSNNFGSSLIVNGSLNNKVIFQGIRFEEWYEDSPGQWNKIWITPGSVNNYITNAVIKNGDIGIHVDTVGNNSPTLILDNTIIQNMSNIGLLAQGSNVDAHNLVIRDCGQYLVALNIGGNYNFTHCTFANYWSYYQNRNRNTPSILLNNYYEGADGNIYVRNLESANFTNCIIYGTLSTEISFQENNSGNFNYNFQNCLIKLDPNTNLTNNYLDCIINKDPIFVDFEEGDLSLDELSPAINSGVLLNDYLIDINGNTRVNPDIGAYER